MTTPNLLSKLATIGDGPIAESESVERYATDVTRNYHGQPIAVMRPRTTEEVAAIVQVCAQAAVSVVPHGGNSGLVGGSVPVHDDKSVVVSLERMNAVRDLDLLSNTVTVEAGCLLVDVQQLAADKDRLFPLRHGGLSSQIGGNLSTNAGGTNVVRYGMARNLVLGIEVVLANGATWNGLNRLPKHNTGYDLKHLFIGAEGTLGIITAAKLKLFPPPQLSETVLFAMNTCAAAVDLLARCRAELDEFLSTFELMSGAAVESVVDTAASPMDSSHEWYVLAEFAATSKRVPLEEMLLDVIGTAADDGLIADAIIAASASQSRKLWNIRERIPALIVEDPTCVKGDSSVPISAIPKYIAAADQGVARLVPNARVLVFGHIGDGNIHYNVLRPPGMSEEEFAVFGPALTLVIENAALELGGSLSAEHGLGQRKMHRAAAVLGDEELELMRLIKRSLDPHGLLNPGKVVEEPDV